MIRSTPNINTSRLALRGMRPEDFDRYAEIWSMPDVVRNIGGAPWDRRRAWESFLRNAGRQPVTGGRFRQLSAGGLAAGPRSAGQRVRARSGPRGP